MSAITVGEDLVHYEVLGRGRIVILLHSWLGSWHYWIPTMRQLQMRYRVYALDLFGFGDSGKNPVRYTISQQVYLLSQFMNEMAITKAGVIGHGLGAQVIAEFARQQPERVARMLLVSAPLFDVEGLENRTPAGHLRPLTNTRDSHGTPPVSRSNQPLASKTSRSTSESPAESHSAETIVRRPAGFDDLLNQQMQRSTDPTVSSAMNQTLASPSAVDREQLRQKAEELNPDTDDYNPLKEALSGSLESLLLRCFKRSEPEFEKLQTYVSRTDEDVIRYVTRGFDAAAMLDTLRLSEVPMVVAHGENDPIIAKPSDNVWNYLTEGREDKILPVPLPGVRHYPMLESEAFNRLIGAFLETPDISNIRVTERWRRRSR